MQSMQDTLTILVALTLRPQQGQAYFLVLEVLPVPGMLGAPLWVPVPPIWKPVNSFLFRRMSVNPFFRTNSRRLSEGEVFVQPYLRILFSTEPAQIAGVVVILIAVNVVNCIAFLIGFLAKCTCHKSGHQQSF